MKQRIKKAHATGHQKDSLHCRQCKIHSIQDLCCTSCLRNKLICLRPRHFRTHQRHGIIIVQRGDHHNKDQHSHSTDPVRKTSPERNSFRKNLNLCQNRRSGCRKSRHSLKKCINIMWDTATDHKRQCSKC